MTFFRHEMWGDFIISIRWKKKGKKKRSVICLQIRQQQTGPTNNSSLHFRRHPKKGTVPGTYQGTRHGTHTFIILQQENENKER